MTKITGDMLVAKLIQSSAFLAQPTHVQNAYRPVIGKLPIFMADLLPELLTYDLLLECKIRFLLNLVQTGVYQTLAQAISVNPDQLLQSYNQDIAELRQIQRQQPMSFTPETQTDRILLGLEIGLNDQMQAVHQSGKLTLELLLYHQPSIIIKPDSKEN